MPLLWIRQRHNCTCYRRWRKASLLLSIVSYERWREIFGEIPRQRKENSVKTYQQRAALLLQVENGSDVNREQQEMCRYYCQEQGYQLSEQHIYQGERV